MENLFVYAFNMSLMLPLLIGIYPAEILEVYSGAWQ